MFGEGKEKSYFYMTVLRCTILSSAVGISYTGISIIDFMDLSGSLFNMLLGFVFPIVFYMTYNWRKLKAKKILWLLALCIGCLVLSIWSFIDALIGVISRWRD